MLGFNSFQTTTPTPPGAHLSHLEDLVFDGPDAVSFVMDILQEFGSILDGGYVSEALNVSVKWDGSPAVVFGPDPADKRFFVATKSAFAKVPKLAKTHEDIDAMYADDRVRLILHQALDELRTLQPEHVLQGDVLFGKACLDDMRGAVRTQVIDGEEFFTFQPNTIVYAVPKNSTLGQQVLEAKFGIVIHTALTGTGQYLNTFKRKNVSPLTYALLKKTPNVLMLDANYDDVSGTATFTEAEHSDFRLALASVQEVARSMPPLIYDVIKGNVNLRRFLYQFVNNRVRNADGSIYWQFDAVGFLQYLDGQEHAERAEKLTERGRISVATRYARLTGEIAHHASVFDMLLQLHLAVQRAKTIIIHKLAQASTIRTFLPTPTGFKASGPEGFVAVCHDSLQGAAGHAVKLVDRLEFSRANFLHRDNGI